MVVKLLTTSACPKCPTAKEMLDVSKIEYKSLTDDDAIVEAQRLNIMMVPTVVDEYDQIYIGINEIQRFITIRLKKIKTPDGEILE